MTDILTLRLDRESQARFDRLRERYFPPERNLIAAHVTLFHALPETDEIAHELQHVSTATMQFSVQVTGVRSLGKGVAYTLSSPVLRELHATLSGSFADHLIPQDRQRFQPHVVVQNKVTPAAARELLQELERGFAPWVMQAEGLDLWHYLGGPWEHVRTFGFAPDAAGSGVQAGGKRTSLADEIR